MPKTPSRISGINTQVMQDTNRIMVELKARPEIVEALELIFNCGRKKTQQQQANCNELAKELDCSGDVLKKAWLKIRENSAKEAAALTESKTRPRSARSATIVGEPRVTRRSMRSYSIDDETASISLSALSESTDNSCASSICTSPRIEDSSTRIRRTTRSRANLSAINELDGFAAPIGTSSQEQQKQQQQQENDTTLKPEDVESSTIIKDISDQHKTADDGASNTSTVEDNRYVENQALDIKASRKHRFSEPSSRTIRNKPSRLLRVDGGGGGGGGGDTTSDVEASTKRAAISSKLPNPDEPTRMFFESMGLTVMSFPQHMQASVKVRVSNIVHQIEYELTSPAHLKNEPPIAAATS